MFERSADNISSRCHCAFGQALFVDIKQDIADMTSSYFIDWHYTDFGTYVLFEH